jgi:hypothetical protein
MRNQVEVDLACEASDPTCRYYVGCVKVITSGMSLFLYTALADDKDGNILHGPVGGNRGYVHGALTKWGLNSNFAWRLIDDIREAVHPSS